jgi:hypothetical protein
LFHLQDLSIPLKGRVLVLLQDHHDGSDLVKVDKGQAAVMVQVGSDHLGVGGRGKGFEHVDEILFLDVVAEVLDDQGVVGISFGALEGLSLG